MKIKFFSLLLACVVTTTTMSAYVIEDVKIGDLHYELETNSKTAKVISKFSDYGNLTSVSVPSSVSYNYQQYSVTSIGKKAFYRCFGLKQIVIPNSVKSIEESAFEICSDLTSVIISYGVISIGENAFAS